MKIRPTTSIKLFLLLLFICNSQYLIAQVPQKMSYQAVVRNTDNALIVNHPVGMRISILQGSANGVSVYTETQTTTTNSNGLTSIIIGNGSVVSGSLSTINWATGNYFIKSEIDPTGGTNYSIDGASQLLSVPYALFSANGPPGPAGTFPQGTNIGDMQYWNGTAWTMIPAGSPGQFLQLNSSNIPQWNGPRFVTLSTMPITEVSQFSAVSGINIIDTGGYPLIKKGICYDTNPNPTINSQIIGGNLSTGSQELPVGYNGLQPTTTYYVRAYAENMAGLVYGNQQVFTTTADGLPTVTTDPVSYVLAYTATLNGSAYYQIPSGITAKGFCYGLAPNPTLANTVVNLGNSNGTFTTILTGLTVSTTYYVRAFATNANGTQYGAEQTFTTCVTPSFAIGQSYGGGKIFYIDCTGQHGLIVANPNSGLIPWGCVGTDIAGTSQEIYSGQTNSNLILSSCSSTNTAARFCDDLSLNGYSDWFLPSIKELKAIRDNNVSPIGVYGCWSSSQSDADNAFGYGLNGPYTNIQVSYKTWNFAVVAIRAF